MIAWLRSTNSRGDIPAWSASTRMGVPCSSEPLTMSTSCPAIRMYRLKTSEGTPNPAMWPRWRGPFAYGQATAESTFMPLILGVGPGAVRGGPSWPERLTGSTRRAWSW